MAKKGKIVTAVTMSATQQKASTAVNVVVLPTNKIYANHEDNVSRWTVRSAADQAYIEDLAANIADQGQLQPVEVMELAKDDAERANGYEYEMIFGYQRLAAVQWLNERGIAKDLGIKATIYQGPKLSDKKRDHRNIAENAKRADLSPMDQSRAVVALQEDGYTNAAIGALFGRSRSWAGQIASLSTLPENLAALQHARVFPWIVGVELAKLGPDDVEFMGKVAERAKKAGALSSGEFSVMFREYQQAKGATEGEDTAEGEGEGGDDSANAGAGEDKDDQTPQKKRTASRRGGASYSEVKTFFDETFAMGPYGKWANLDGDDIKAAGHDPIRAFCNHMFAFIDGRVSKEATAKRLARDVMPKDGGAAEIAKRIKMAKAKAAKKAEAKANAKAESAGEGEGGDEGEE